MIYTLNGTEYDLSAMGQEVKEDFLTLSEVQNELALLSKKAYVLQCCATELNRKIQSNLPEETLIKED